MSKHQGPISIQQTATNGKGGKIQQAGNNLNTKASTNILIIPILIGMTAMGGIAWAIYAGINHQDKPSVEQIRGMSSHSHIGSIEWGEVSLSEINNGQALTN